MYTQHWNDLQVPLTVVGPSQNKGPDVHWDKVSDLKTGTRYKYINYTDVIEMERLPAISPFTNEVRETISSVCAIVASCHMTHITACHINSIVLLLYTHSMLEHCMYAKLPKDGYRCVYFEPQPDPARPVMRVAENVKGNVTVKKITPGKEAS